MTAHLPTMGPANPLYILRCNAIHQNIAHRLGTNIKQRDKRAMIARILDQTFKKAELMSYEDFRANGRLLYDIVRFQFS